MQRHRRRRHRRVARGVAAVATAVALTAGVAACSSSGHKVSATPEASYARLGGENTTVVLDADFMTALSDAGITLKPEGTAKFGKDGKETTAVFPITAGNLAVYKRGAVNPKLVGEIDHTGSGLTLTGKGKTITVKNLVLHPGPGPSLTGEVDLTTGGATTVVSKNMTVFLLDNTTLKKAKTDKGVTTLEGTTVFLSKDAAAALNQTYGLSGAKALTADNKLEVGATSIKVRA